MQPQRDRARRLIEDAITGGREPLARDIQHMAAELGISISTLLYAKKEMGIGSRLAGLPAQSGQHWFWTASARHGKRAFEVEGTGRRSRRKRPVSTSGTTKP
jgi:hypothetical protein